jgi:hypothetical protein
MIQASRRLPFVIYQYCPMLCIIKIAMTTALVSILLEAARKQRQIRRQQAA